MHYRTCTVKSNATVLQFRLSIPDQYCCQCRLAEPQLFSSSSFSGFRSIIHSQSILLFHRCNFLQQVNHSKQVLNATSMLYSQRIFPIHQCNLLQQVTTAANKYYTRLAHEYTTFRHSDNEIEFEKRILSITCIVPRLQHLIKR